MKRYSILRCNIEEQWTAMTDIGKEYSGNKLTAARYLDAENTYVSAINLIVRYMSINKFKIKNLYKENDITPLVVNRPELINLYTPTILKTYKNINGKKEFGLTTLRNLIRLELREDIGGLIYVPYRMKLYIGYDYMMGIDTSVDLSDIYSQINKLGLELKRY